MSTTTKPNWTLAFLLGLALWSLAGWIHAGKFALIPAATTGDGPALPAIELGMPSDLSHTHPPRPEGRHHRDWDQDRMEPEHPRHVNREGPAWVLLAEHEPTVRAMAELALRGNGDNVIATGAAAEMLDLSTHRADPLRLVVVDVDMPGLSGPQFAEVCRARHPHPSVLFLSAHEPGVLPGFDFDFSRATSIAILVKPFASDDLLCVERRVVGEAPPAGMPAAPAASWDINPAHMAGRRVDK